MTRSSSGSALPQAHREVLGFAAVIGAEVDAATLVATVGSQVALAGLDEIVATGLLEPVLGADGLYRFLHALARQAVLDLMPAAHRAHLHGRVAEVLEDRGGPVQRLAHHYAAAHLLGHADKAVHYLAEAARVADRSLAHAEAARLLERAAGLCTDPYERDDYRLAAARSYHLACDFARARALFLLVGVHGDLRHRLRAATAFEDAPGSPPAPAARHSTCSRPPCTGSPRTSPTPATSAPSPGSDAPWR